MMVAMTSLGRRLQRIEAASRAASTLGAERHAAMKSLALEHLSSEDLDALEDILEQGTQANQWTEREAGAVKAFTTFEQEVRKAGYATVGELQRSCGIELRSA
jgi:vacuolar-type H+-ATPase subunit H